MYKDETTPIRVVGKILSNKEMEEIRDVITNEINVEVTFDSPTTLGLHSITRSYKKDVGTSETTFHKGSLRSGQKLEVEGSVVIIGDVNSGAEVIAADNIAVIGTLRGLAHAGAKGNKKAIIAAHRIECPQLRIANIVKEMEKEELDEEYKYASANEENQIILEKWKEKSKKHPFYINAIETWTKRDVEKRSKAKENNINFKEVWSLEEGKKIIDELYGTTESTIATNRSMDIHSRRDKKI